jgi:hypothetical protein
VQNYISHRDMDFGMPMPHCRDILAQPDLGCSVGEAIKGNVVFLESWGKGVMSNFEADS